MAFLRCSKCGAVMTGGDPPECPQCGAGAPGAPAPDEAAEETAAPGFHPYPLHGH